MPKVTFIEPDGTSHTIEGSPGQSVMQLAKAHGIAAIVAECGGACMCATCHCYVDEADFDAVGGPGESEDEMLEMTASPRQPNSRLSCQIQIEEVGRDFVVHLPASQT